MYEGFVVALAVLAAGIAAVAGFGIGSLLTPALAVAMGTKVAVAAVALPHMVATALRLWVLRRAIDRAVLLTFGLASAAGGLAGALLHAVLGSPVLSILLGSLLVLAGLYELVVRSRRVMVPGGWATAAGVLSGLFGGLVGNQGGIRSAALLRFRLDRQALVATATASALLVDAARVPVYLVTTGTELLNAWPLILALTGGVVVGTVLGAPVLRRVPEPLFRRVLAVLLIGLGAALIAGLSR